MLLGILLNLSKVSSGIVELFTYLLLRLKQPKFRKSGEPLTTNLENHNKYIIGVLCTAKSIGL